MLSCAAQSQGSQSTHFTSCWEWACRLPMGHNWVAHQALTLTMPKRILLLWGQLGIPRGNYVGVQTLSHHASTWDNSEGLAQLWSCFQDQLSLRCDGITVHLCSFPHPTSFTPSPLFFPKATHQYIHCMQSLLLKVWLLWNLTWETSPVVKLTS